MIQAKVAPTVARAASEGGLCLSVPGFGWQALQLEWCPEPVLDSRESKDIAPSKRGSIGPQSTAFEQDRTGYSQYQTTMIPLAPKPKAS